MKILIADDDPQILRALRITLTAKGYEIITATNGAEAISAAIDHKPDIYLLDLGMPELDGIDVIHGIRGWSESPSSSSPAAPAPPTKWTPSTRAPTTTQTLLRRSSSPASEPSPAASPHTTATCCPPRRHRHRPRRPKRHGPVTDTTPIRLTPTEWQVIEILIRNTGNLVTRQTLLTSIWGTEHATDTGSPPLRVSTAQEARPNPPTALPHHRSRHGLPPPSTDQHRGRDNGQTPRRRSTLIGIPDTSPPDIR
jgi:two-component system KDP operon response regulator KdpE